MLALEVLLEPLGFDRSKRTKLVRHQDKRYDLAALYREGQFEFYQSMQSRPAFGDAEQIVSFMGRDGTHATFLGVYSVEGVEGPNDYAVPPGYLYPDMQLTQNYRYDLRLDPRFEALRNRVVIDWGMGARSWVQNFRPAWKPVVQVLPEGYVQPFPGFLDIVLSYHELAGIIRHPVTHRDWQMMLKSVAGIYLILDTASGRQYVGSAYGEGGLLARWTSYVRTSHGGNHQLKALVDADPKAAERFRFSVLQTLPITYTTKEVIQYEVLHKQKLGTRAYGLNSN